MQTWTTHQARTRFGAFIDMVQKEPVRVLRHGRVVGVMVPPEDYEAMRVFYANRLLTTLARTSSQAQQAGLRPDRLDALLADDS